MRDAGALSLATDKKMKFPAAKVFPAHAGDPHSPHRSPAVKPSARISLLTRSGPMLRLLYEESGQDLVEYAFILALVGLGAVAALSGLAGSLKNVLNAVSSNLISAT
jgi:Flp pilus assembly pilin Flp